MAEGFQDRLAALWAERAALDDRADRDRRRQDRESFLQGEATAAAIIGQVATYGSTYARNAETLENAASRQPDTLAGRVAASRLSESAAERRTADPEASFEARWRKAQALAMERREERDLGRER